MKLPAAYFGCHEDKLVLILTFKCRATLGRLMAPYFKANVAPPLLKEWKLYLTWSKPISKTDWNANSLPLYSLRGECPLIGRQNSREEFGRPGKLESALKACNGQRGHPEIIFSGIKPKSDPTRRVFSPP